MQEQNTKQPTASDNFQKGHQNGSKTNSTGTHSWQNLIPMVSKICKISSKACARSMWRSFFPVNGGSDPNQSDNQIELVVSLITEVSNYKMYNKLVSMPEAFSLHIQNMFDLGDDDVNMYLVDGGIEFWRPF